MMDHYRQLEMALFDAVVANESIAKVIDGRTPPLGDGSGDAGAFDALPNEMLAAIAIQLWPAPAVIALAHTCRRLRDNAYAEFVLLNRSGPRDYRWLFREACGAEPPADMVAPAWQQQ